MPRGLSKAAKGAVVPRGLSNATKALSKATKGPVGAAKGPVGAAKGLSKATRGRLCPGACRMLLGAVECN